MTEDSLLKLFKEQLENQSTKLAKDNGLSQRGLHLIWWYFLELEGLTTTEVEECVCDGAGDLAIDAIWINDDDVVHIYQFKNPVCEDKQFNAGNIDRMISGLRLIFDKKHDGVANEAVKARIDEIYQIVPKAYRLHLVTSGIGIDNEAKTKLDAFVESLNSPSTEFFQWELEDLVLLQARFYQQNLPAIEDPIVFCLPQQPYIARSGGAVCYLYDSTAENLAALYLQHGEGLLQRNIRADQGLTSTNRTILASCTGEESGHFLHYNNGLSFLCENATWDPVLGTLTLQGAQVVNGGQTIRALARANKEGSLMNNVRVPLRAITSNGDKQFASNVTVNQNNQNSMKTGFLRSNHPHVVQLGNSLASLGWYLERREGELRTITEDERVAIESKIGNSLDNRVITLKGGTQAYVATFYRHPEMAKKNAKKMFLGSEDGGFFDKIFSADLTADKMVIAAIVKKHVDNFVKEFKSKARKKIRQAEAEWKAEYGELLGEHLVKEFNREVEQAIPQCAIFLSATVFFEHTDLNGEDPATLPSLLDSKGREVMQDHLAMIFKFAQENPTAADKGWPSLLKSQKFYTSVTVYMRGVKAGESRNVVSPTHS